MMTWGPALSSEAIVVNEVAARYNIVQVRAVDEIPPVSSATPGPNLSCVQFNPLGELNLTELD